MTVQPQQALSPVAQREAVAPATAAEAAQRRAWFCIITGFVVWLVLVGVGLTSANTWRKTTYIAPPAQLLSKQGIVLYQGPRDTRPVSIAERTDLEEGAILEVPASSEAVIRIDVDNSTIHLRPSSRLRLTTMRVGRFNRDLTQVRLEQLQGAASYQVAGELPDSREVEVRTPHTAGPQDSLKLNKGEYLVWVQPMGTRLLSYDGQARAEVNGSVIRLRDGKWVVLGPERPDLRQALDLPEHLIRNRDFARGVTEAWKPTEVGEKGRPDVGGTRTIVNEVINGKPTRTLRFFRATEKDTHNETGLLQTIDREVSAYRKVTFSALVKVNNASLDGGGYAGSEYPMMFRIKYVAENGGIYNWVHGFYVKNDTNRPTEIGEQIEAGQWYSFTLEMMDLPDRPAYIASLEVFAAGHDFDAQVGGIEFTVE
jgi:hypothetical protein